ncbi:hypothetical protein [Candidatus Palauibacter sp.]|uniref:hypothetical protein n=1 Tax=Candidatus Palauibacter sp. TaxID=3101350 RepID=UPI003B5A01C9
METDTMGILGVLLAVIASAISLAVFTRGATNKLDDRITELRGQIGKVGTEVIETRVAMTDRVARLEGHVFGTPPPEAAAETA